MNVLKSCESGGFQSGAPSRSEQVWQQSSPLIAINVGSGQTKGRPFPDFKANISSPAGLRCPAVLMSLPSALVVGYFQAAESRNGDYKRKERSPLSALKPRRPATCCLVEYFTNGLTGGPADGLSSQSRFLVK